MISKEEFERLSKKYEPFITNIINSNLRFYYFNEKIRWCFGYDEKDAIVATCNKNTNVITVNLKSFERSLKEENLKTIEYFLLHEIRHIYQHLVIASYKKEKKEYISKEIILKWIFESKNYVKSLTEDGKENPKYFLQDSEMDAYAFSLAVMRYKYKKEEIDHLYVPSLYGIEFTKLVQEWMQTFSSDGL